MGQVEELDEEQGICAVCQKAADLKCKACTTRKVFYCRKECQKKHWKEHKYECEALALPYKIESSAQLGKFLVASPLQHYIDIFLVAKKVNIMGKVVRRRF